MQEILYDEAHIEAILPAILANYNIFAAELFEMKIPRGLPLLKLD